MKSDQVVGAARPPYPWTGIAIFALAVAVLAAVWKGTPLGNWLRPEHVSAWAGSLGARWYAGPLAVAVFIAGGFMMVPLLALAFACGMVFGAWPGAAYALTGAMAGASASFAVGRRLGRERLRRLLGERIRRFEGRVVRRGILAVFLVRKIPAPYGLVNLAAGASEVRFRDFFLGTLLGTGPGVVLLSVLGDRFARPAVEAVTS
ncbi:MAG TPA: VTT domain-containing protein [Planctomycetota bacterium]|nr:VTT domain-containing protein [Planctomycetota bacterium]